MDEICMKIINVMSIEAEPMTIYKVSQHLQQRENQVRYHLKKHLVNRKLAEKEELENKTKYKLKKEVFYCEDGQFLLKLDNAITRGYCEYAEKCPIIHKGDTEAKCKKWNDLKEMFLDYFSNHDSPK